MSLAGSSRAACRTQRPTLAKSTTTGDIVETALILGRWGYAEAFDDAERILRGHLLPSQLRDVSWIQEPSDPAGGDGRRNVARRHLGAFGFPAPYGHRPVEADRISFNMDIVGGAVASLCEAYRAVTRFDAAGHWVNLLFDHRTDAVEVESPYPSGVLGVTVRRPGPLFVRVPAWANVTAVRVKGAVATAPRTERYLMVAEPPVGRRITFAFDLPSSELVLRHRTRDIRVKLWGDAVEAMDNFGQDLTFFDPID